MPRLLFGLIATTSCWFGSTPPVRAPATDAPFLLAGKPWPQSSPVCTISQRAIFSDADCDALAVDVRRSPADPQPFATLDSTYGQGRATWSELPLIGAYPGVFSHVEITEGGMHVRGTSQLENVRFRLRHDFAIDPGHLWIAAGAKVSILGTSGDRIGIGADAPFDAPSRWQALVPCDQFGAPDAPPSRTAAKLLAVPIAPALSIRDAPNGREILRVHADTSPPFDWIGEQNGFVHVVTPASETIASSPALLRCADLG